MSRSDLLVVAGEASGDLHAARLLGALKRRRPDLRAFGMGSDELRGEGMEILADSRDISVVGIAEAARVLARAREILADLVQAAERRRPSAAILVDFPDFNLRLARELRWLGIPVVYYVSPQIWAWRRGRVRQIAETVDRMLVLFGFEVPFYEGHGIPVTHVGHPLIDEVPQLTQAWSKLPYGALPDQYQIALMPGSRRSEIGALLPVQLDAIQRLKSVMPVRARLIRAPSIPPEEIDRLVPPGTEIEIVSGPERFAAIADSHLALCASGTATLETGLLGTPLIVLYRLSGLTWLLAKLLVRVPHASLVNLVLGQRAVPELLQRQANPQHVAATMTALLRDRGEVERMRRTLAEIRPRLGRAGASERAAETILALLDERQRAA